ncbi:hypothetical protein PQC39_gp056 [Vibrio phage Vp_R1]|uniref:Uncharacterized protein n=1 Tax=Vibrio phage Vp_R1 TaxID=2059867 RepID=A0A2H5BQ14_9CAUD|nr:hypothetical protein PQC39_gp056 [Vibrio phage Vp_R1]AUG88420.1 hypothetical protein VPR_056 [Vibrio phage Vp_R1]
MTTKKVFDEKGWESQKEFFIDSNLPTASLKKEVFMREHPYPKQEVLDWLTENVPDRNGKKGWCIGSDEYIAGDSCAGFTFFFQIRADAMKFIKAWSKWKKPVIYTQYFTDVRRKLNLETMKYEDM